jgi:hypothetical protein
MASDSPIFDCCAEPSSEYQDSTVIPLDLPPVHLELQGDNSNVDQCAKSEITLVGYEEGKEEENGPHSCEITNSSSSIGSVGGQQSSYHLARFSWWPRSGFLLFSGLARRIIPHGVSSW